MHVWNSTQEHKKKSSVKRFDTMTDIDQKIETLERQLERAKARNVPDEIVTEIEQELTKARFEDQSPHGQEMYDQYREQLKQEEDEIIKRDFERQKYSWRL